MVSWCYSAIFFYSDDIDLRWTRQGMGMCSRRWPGTARPRPHRGRAGAENHDQRSRKAMIGLFKVFILLTDGTKAALFAPLSLPNSSDTLTDILGAEFPSSWVWLQWLSVSSPLPWVGSWGRLAVLLSRRRVPPCGPFPRKNRSFASLARRGSTRSALSTDRSLDSDPRSETKMQGTASLFAW